eukprot:13855837-Heterocapsa_arctica.AAC.1
MRSRDSREIDEKVRERATEESISAKELGVSDISALTHQETAAWDDVKNVWLDPSRVKEARKEEMVFVHKMSI